MMNPRSSEPFVPVVLGLAALVVTPGLVLLAPNGLVATLTATPLRQAVSATILLILLAGWSLWVVAGVSIRATVPSEGGES